MEELAGGGIAEMVADPVHAETQVEDNAVTLTAGTIYRLEGSPSFDFGGSEYEPAEAERIEPEKRSDDDKYGWWELERGVYLVKFNEGVRVPEGSMAVLQAWWKVLSNGLSQPTQVFTGDHTELHQVIYVPEHGANIKENARISELKVFK